MSATCADSYFSGRRGMSWEDTAKHCGSDPCSKQAWELGKSHRLPEPEQVQPEPIAKAKPKNKKRLRKPKDES